jgi:hypothetical protein
LPRILSLARARGLDLVPIPADHRSDRPPFHPAGLIPQASSLRLSQIAIWELLGRSVGR